MAELRKIGAHLYARSAASDSNGDYFMHQEFAATVNRGLTTITGVDPVTKTAINRVVDVPTPGWSPGPIREWVHSPTRRFESVLNGLYPAAFALPRVMTPAEVEIDRLRRLGLEHTATLMEQANPPAPPNMIAPEGCLFEINADLVRIGKDGVRLLELSSDEIRGWLQRHTLGDGGELGSYAKGSVTWTEDAVFCPPAAGPAFESDAALSTG
jgi:hypothetical protein